MTDATTASWVRATTSQFWRYWPVGAFMTVIFGLPALVVAVAAEGAMSRWLIVAMVGESVILTTWITEYFQADPEERDKVAELDLSPLLTMMIMYTIPGSAISAILLGGALLGSVITAATTLPPAAALLAALLFPATDHAVNDRIGKSLGWLAVWCTLTAWKLVFRAYNVRINLPKSDFPGFDKHRRL